MYAVIKGKLHRVVDDKVQYVSCPFVARVGTRLDPIPDTYPCGTWCALFEIQAKEMLAFPEATRVANKNVVVLHCSNAKYDLISDIKSQPKEGSES